MGESVTTKIVEAIAEKEGTDPTDLDFSLQSHIDVDALRLLMEHDSTSWTLTFTVDEHEILVSGDGLVQVNCEHSGLTSSRP